MKHSHSPASEHMKTGGLTMGAGHLRSLFTVYLSISTALGVSGAIFLQIFA